jgi:uncharacterized beta-barrel protein YwiB (DUF1934 family)
MDKKAVIHLLSIQSDNEDEKVEVVTPGSFSKKGDTFYAIYDETEISGMEGTTTTLKIADNKFSIIRMGSTNAEMEFQKSKPNVSLYDTPYGTLELNINTRDLNIKVDEDGAEVYVRYNLSISGMKAQSTTLNIKIKTQNA